MKKLLTLMALCLMLLLVGCNEVKYADRTLKAAEGIYKTVHQASTSVYADVTLPVQERLDFKAKMLQPLQLAEASVKSANLALQAYITAKEAGKTPDKSALIQEFSLLVTRTTTIASIYNTFMEGIGKEPVEVPEDLKDAFGLL